jgi:hypothetical protein
VEQQDLQDQQVLKVRFQHLCHGGWVYNNVVAKKHGVEEIKSLAIYPLELKRYVSDNHFRVSDAFIYWIKTKKIPSTSFLGLLSEDNINHAVKALYKDDDGYWLQCVPNINLALKHIRSKKDCDYASKMLDAMQIVSDNKDRCKMVYLSKLIFKHYSLSESVVIQ